MKYLTLAFLLIATVSFSQPETESEHIIDVRERACNDSTQQTTIDMIECAIQAEKAWAIEMNTIYNQLMTVLSEDEKTKLKLAQRNWMAYHTSEVDFSRTVYVNMQGTMWRVVLAMRATQLTKERALALKDYWDNLH